MSEERELTDLLRQARVLLGPDSDAMLLTEHRAQVGEWLGTVAGLLDEETPV